MKGEQRLRSVWLTLALLAATCAAGLLCRFAPLGLPPFWVKYGGSALWALAIYWLVSASTARLSRAACLAGTIAAAVEFAKLLAWPPLDAFRLTFAGKLLLGRIFSFRDLLAYALAIAAGAAADLWMRRRVNKAPFFRV